MEPIYEYDAVIVGAGMSGALVACELAGKGLRVLVLEAGDEAQPRNFQGEFEDKFKDPYVKLFSELPQKDRLATRPYKTEGGAKFAHHADGDDLKLNKDVPFGPDKYLDQPGPKPWKSQYVRLTGGSTQVWRGNSPRLIPDDFRLRSLYPELAAKFPDVADWPITYDELEPWYTRAEEELGVAADHDEWHGLFGAKRSKQFPMKAIAQSYGDLQLIEAFKKVPREMRSLDGIEIKIFTLPQARVSEEGFNGRHACRGNNNCIPVCPTGAKYDATIHIQKAAKLGVEFRHRSVVTRLEADASGNISKVWYRGWDGNDASVTGRFVVIAAHGIETPKILLLSDNVAPKAKEKGVVGAFLMDHLGGEGAALMPFRTFPFRGPQSTSCIESFRNHPLREKMCAFRLTVGNDGWGRSKHPYSNLEDLLARRLFGEELREGLFDTVTRQMRLAYSTEQLPNKSNCVKLSAELDALGIPKPRTEFNVDEYSLEGMRYAQKVIKHIFTAVGAPERSWEFSDLKDLASVFYSGSGHIMGTCRMGDTPGESVVNRWGRAHEHPNLYITDASVFPTASTANPTITTAALALRAAGKMIADAGNGA
jgi:glucose dehydrogenase